MMNEMNYDLIEQFEFLISKMKNEGFHYCFKHYSTFKEIEDREFHNLRMKYLECAEDLEKYVYKKYDELLNQEYSDDEE